MASQLYGVGAYDPLALVGATLVLGLCARPVVCRGSEVAPGHSEMLGLTRRKGEYIRGGLHDPVPASFGPTIHHDSRYRSGDFRDAGCALPQRRSADLGATNPSPRGQFPAPAGLGAK